MPLRSLLTLFMLCGFAVQALAQAGSFGPYKTDQGVSPYRYGAACDNVTDDTLAFRAMFAALATGAGNTTVNMPTGTHCLVTIPGGYVTSYAVAGGVATFTGGGFTLHAGDLVTLQGFATGTQFNGLQVTVLASGLSATQFQATYYGPSVTSTSEPGTTVGGQTFYAQAVSPAFQINFPGLAIVGTNYQNAGTANSGFYVYGGPGAVFQFGYNKTSNIVSASSNSSGVLTILYSLAENTGHPINYHTGGSLVVANTGTTLNGTYAIATKGTASCAIGTCGQLTTNTGTAPASISETYAGTIHAPWTNTEYDGVQGAHFTKIDIHHRGTTPYGTATHQVNCIGSNGVAAGAQCTYIPATYAIQDWGGGSMILNEVNASYYDTAFFAEQSDFDHLFDFQGNYNHKSIYLGPTSDQATINDFGAFAEDRGIELDGVRSAVINHATIQGGAPNYPPVGITNRNYDTLGFSTTGGGKQSNSIMFRDLWLEQDNNSWYGCFSNSANATPYFIGIDTDSDAAARTLGISLDNIQVINPGPYGSVNCNVNYLLGLTARPTAYSQAMQVAIDHLSNPSNFLRIALSNYVTSDVVPIFWFNSTGSNYSGSGFQVGTNSGSGFLRAPNNVDTMTVAGLYLNYGYINPSGGLLNTTVANSAATYTMAQGVRFIVNSAASTITLLQGAGVMVTVFYSGQAVAMKSANGASFYYHGASLGATYNVPSSFVGQMTFVYDNTYWQVMQTP